MAIHTRVCRATQEPNTRVVVDHGGRQREDRVRAASEPANHRLESGRRVAVWIVVIVCHLGWLMLLLQPTIDDVDRNPLANTEARALELRFVHVSRPSTMPQILPTPALSIQPGRQAIRSTRRTTAATAWRAMHIPSPPAETHAIPAEPITMPAGDDADASSDGGFGQRLREAQHGAAIRGVPGSDKAFVPAMHFVDPMDQGIGAVARKAQRLFGIKSRQCIDVEALRKLTTRELLARHISPDDVDRKDEKYACNAPPGLHF
jgi:hypothetical protein